MSAVLSPISHAIQKHANARRINWSRAVKASPRGAASARLLRRWSATNARAREYAIRIPARGIVFRSRISHAVSLSRREEGISKLRAKARCERTEERSDVLRKHSVCPFVAAKSARRMLYPGAFPPFSFAADPFSEDPRRLSFSRNPTFCGRDLTIFLAKRESRVIGFLRRAPVGSHGTR